MSLAVQLQEVTKTYRLGTVGGRTLREDVQRWWCRLRGRPDPLAQVTVDARQGEGDRILALDSVSLDVKKGEILGIVGRNGAGKSTLLKLLSKITAPTTGVMRINGRTGSLLEVGTGFHGELTGRENVFLNGSILGMSKTEIQEKFDEIVEFSGIAPFIDTPVKRYSSGMSVRLAFAVAAHLEPEILLIDEVLAVGDAAFQRKCIGKMGEVAGEGRTILFVSHNMGLIREIAERGVWLEEGRIMYDGSISEAVSRYLASGITDQDAPRVDLKGHPNRLKGMRPIFQAAETRTTESSDPVNHFSQRDTLRLRIKYEDKTRSELSGIGFIVSDVNGVVVGSFNSYMATPPPHSIDPIGVAEFILPISQFTPGTYFLTVSIGSHYSRLEDKVEECLSFTVHAADIYGTGYMLTSEDGVCSLDARVILHEEGGCAD